MITALIAAAFFFGLTVVIKAHDIVRPVSG
jgi:hypothetical protein